MCQPAANLPQVNLGLTPKWAIHELVIKNKLLFTSEVCAELLRNFPKLIIVNDEFGTFKFLTMNGLSDLEISDLQQDLEFFMANSYLPVKYLCSRMNNFNGQTDEQRLLYDEASGIARKDVIYVKRGVFLSGHAQVGKTRLAIAIAKFWHQHGFSTVFITPENAVGITAKMLPHQIWVFAKFNETNSHISDLFHRAIRGTHSHASMLVVTSTQSYSALLDATFIKNVNGKPPYDRRAQEQFGMLPLAGIEEPHKTSLVGCKHEESSISDLDKLCTNHVDVITPVVFRELACSYRLLLEKQSGITKINPYYLTSDLLNNLICDLSYFITFPGIPTCCVCSRLQNFKTKTIWAQVALEEANKLASLTSLEDVSGLFLTGPTGIGKTHLAIGITKQLFELGLQLYFVTPETLLNFVSIPMTKEQIWVFDDCSNFSNHAMNNFILKALSNTCANGGLLIITSVLDYQQFFKRIFSGKIYFKADEVHYMELADKLFGAHQTLQVQASLQDLTL